MQKIDQLKSDIAHTIKESAEYKEYKRLEAVVNMDPNLKRSIDEFRRRNYEIQNLKEGTDVYTEMEQLEEEYHEIRKNPLISDYLQYELGLCHIMQRINLSLVGTVDLDIGDFKDIIKW